MSIALATHLSFCTVEGRALFLDVTRDRYFQLVPALEDAFLRAASDPTHGIEPTAFEALRTAGILVKASDGAALMPCRSPIPNQSLLPTLTRPPVRPADLLEVALDLLRIDWILRRSGLAPLVAAARRRSRERLASAISTADSVARFRAARRVVPAQFNCLRDSAALLSFLHRRGLHGSLVLGVKPRPFLAHCWLQDGDTVLNDDLDRASGFTPILVT